MKHTKGHVLFEMCSGYELYAPKPTARHLEDLQSYPQVHWTHHALIYLFSWILIMSLVLHAGRGSAGLHIQPERGDNLI